MIGPGDILAVVDWHKIDAFIWRSSGELKFHCMTVHTNDAIFAVGTNPLEIYGYICPWFERVHCGATPRAFILNRVGTA